eukprot:GHVU01078885.1.p2 GENE.GHVU01078885.1~~GHVU01078885.1.p2  ORF type:complete len:135 (-),score=7.40 GHVU01078885.1:183-587(-)
MRSFIHSSVHPISQSLEGSTWRSGRSARVCVCASCIRAYGHTSVSIHTCMNTYLHTYMRAYVNARIGSVSVAARERGMTRGLVRDHRSVESRSERAIEQSSKRANEQVGKWASGRGVAIRSAAGAAGAAFSVVG